MSEDDVLVVVLGDPLAGAVPEAPAAPAAQPGVEGLDYHVVRAGETLSGIARARLGDAALAGELARRNGLVDPDALEPGQVLRLR